MFGSNGLSAADVAAVVRNNDGCCNYGGYGMMNGMGGYGFGEGWWVIIILAVLFGGFGRNGIGGFGGGCNPCGCEAAVATVGDVERGFNNQTVVNKLNGLENGLCDGFYAMNTAVLNSTNQLQTAIQQSTVANLQNTYALQNTIQQDTIANMQNTNALSRQFADCCCENRQGQAQIQYELAANSSAITTAIQNQTTALMQNQNDNYRALHDELVSYRMQDKDETIAALRSQVQALNLAQSQANQNTYLVNQLRPCPQPAYIVANPFCCNGQQYASYQNSGCCAQCG